MISQRLFKSDFLKNIATLLTGSVVAQAIPLAAIPILTRLYSPEEFGLFALYMALASVISVIATGRYELSIMLPKREQHALDLVFLSIIISVVISILTLILVTVFNSQIAELLGNQEIDIWLYWIPVSVLLTGIYQSINYWSNRKKYYKKLATNRVIKNGAMVAVQTSAGPFGVGTSGLILGNLFGQLCATIVLWKSTFKWPATKKNRFGRLRRFALIKTYRKLPLYSMPMAFLNTLSNQIKPIVFTRLFSEAVVGWVFMAERILQAPLALISSAYASVFYQKFVETDKKIQLYMKSFCGLLALSLALLSPVYFFGAEIFSFLLGEQWAEAGEIAVMIYPMACVSFAMGAVSIIYTAIDRNEVSLAWQVVYFIGLVFIFTVYSSETFQVIIQLMVFWSVSMYLLLFIIGGLLIEKKYP